MNSQELGISKNIINVYGIDLQNLKITPQLLTHQKKSYTESKLEKDIQQEICQEISLIPTNCVNICMIPEPGSLADNGLWSSEKNIIELYNKHIKAGNDAYPRVDISGAISNKLKEKYNNEQ